MLIAKAVTAAAKDPAAKPITAVAIIVPAAYEGAANARSVAAKASLLNPIFIFFSKPVFFVF